MKEKERYVHIEKRGFDKIKDPLTEAWNVHMTMDDSCEIEERPNAKIVWPDEAKSNPNFPLQSMNSHPFKQYELEELHGMKGTIYVGVDSAYCDDKTTVTMFRSDETGKCFILDITHSNIKDEGDK